MIYGISGKKQSGKNTVVKIWQLLDIYYNEIPYKYRNDIEHIKSHLKYDTLNHLSSNWQHKFYAEKLKQIVCILFGCTMDQLENEDFKNTKIPEIFKLDNYLPTYRELLQQLGTDILRKYLHPNIWILSLFNDYKESIVKNKLDTHDRDFYKGDYPNWLISDVRFPNEVEAIKEKQGKVIRINRSWVHKADIAVYNNTSFPNVKDDTHTSETALNNYNDFDYIINNNGTIENLIIQVKNIMIKENIINY